MLARLRPVTRVLCPPGAARALGTAAKASPPHLLSLADLQVPHIAAVLQRAAELAPVHGNAQGTYLTFRSQDALIFGIVNICGE